MKTLCIVNDDPILFSWVQKANARGGDFLRNLTTAVFHADGENQALMYPLLKALQSKHPEYK